MAFKRRAAIISREAVLSNDDMLQEILARVPAMPLLRFKCVSKQWLSIISNSKFASFHARLNSRSSLVSGLYLSSKHKKDVTFFFSLDSHTGTTHSLSFLGKVAKKLSIIDSCNGLLLCYCYNPFRYLVCNPTTRQYTLIPDNGNKVNKYSAILVFDPLKSPHYKVAIICWDSNHYWFDIYSSATKSWEKTELQRHFSMPSDMYSTPSVYWEGAIHWTTSHIKKGNFHFRFDVDAKELEVISLPLEPRVYNGDNIRYFGVSGDGKSLLRVQSKLTSPMGVRILEMGKGCASWTVKREVGLRYSRNEFSVVHVIDGETEDDDPKLVLAIGDKLFSYDVNFEKQELLGEKQELIGDLPFCHLDYLTRGYVRKVCGYQFVVSLAPV